MAKKKQTKQAQLHNEHQAIIDNIIDSVIEIVQAETDNFESIFYENIKEEARITQQFILKQVVLGLDAKIKSLNK